MAGPPLVLQAAGRQNAAGGAPPARRPLLTGPERRPALCRYEVAVLSLSGERFPATWSGRTAVVAAAGEVDLTNADGFRTALLAVLDAGALGLVADMTATTFIDSAGITALVRASRRAAAGEASVRLAVTAPAVLRVLNLVGIDQLIEVYPSVPAAVASLADQTGQDLLT